MSAIFSEISQHSRFTFREFDENVIGSLASEIISILKHPRKTGLRASDLFLLKDRITHLQQSPLGKHFEPVVKKIEKAIERYGKHLLISRSVLEKRFPKELHYLVDLFHESPDEKIPLSIVYKLYNLPLLSLTEQRLSLFVTMILKTSEKAAYISLISKHILAREDPIPFLEILSKQKDGGYILLKHAAPVFEHHEEPFLIPTYYIDKLFILKMMALFFDSEQEVDTSAFLKLFNTNVYSRKINFDAMIKRIPKERRLPSLVHAAKFFTDDLELWQKLTYVLEVSLSPECKGDPLQIASLFPLLRMGDYYFAIENIPLIPLDPTFRKELLEDALKIASQFASQSLIYDHYMEIRNAKRASKILNIFFKIELPRDKRASRLVEIEKMLDTFDRVPTGKELTTYLHALCQTPNDRDMRDAMQGVYRILHAKIFPICKYFLSTSYALISSVPVTERDYYIDMTVEAAKRLDHSFKKSEVLICLLLLTEEERIAFMMTLPDNIKTAPIPIKNGIQLALHLSPRTADQMISSGDLPKEVHMRLCRYIYNNAKSLNLFDQHPLILKVTEFLTIENARGLKNPFNLRKKLIEMADLPLDYKPAVAINLKTFQEISQNAPIHRNEIPEEATADAFNALFDNLSTKQQENPKDFEAALKQLNPDLTWTSISGEIPLLTLRGLLSITTDIAPDDEAKWRKVLSTILSKSTSETEAYFTEQESVQITTQYMIQQCPIGIHGGIDDAYQSLPSHLKYPSKPLSKKSNDSLLQDYNQNNALQFLTEWIDPNIPFDDLCIRLIKVDPQTLIALLPSLIGYDIKYWDVTADPLQDPDAKWYLKLAGAKAALHKALKTKEVVQSLLLPILRDYIGKIFNRGNDKVIQHFIGPVPINQAIHQTTYIKHLIGHHLGLPKEIILDRHSGLIYQQLLDATVPEVLDAFFLHHPPQDFVHEVMRTIHSDDKNTLPTYFHNPAYWTETGLTQLGALELLVQGEFFFPS